MEKELTYQEKRDMLDARVMVYLYFSFAFVVALTTYDTNAYLWAIREGKTEFFVVLGLLFSLPFIVGLVGFAKMVKIKLNH